jgi:hypothetical protein
MNVEKRNGNVKMIVGGLALGALASGACDGGAVVGHGYPGSTYVQTAPASGLAVVGGDFTSSVISLLNADGSLAKDDCIDSGTAPSDKLSLALSGDVTLPSQAQHGGQLWVVDRGNAALTVLEPTTCEPVRQISVAKGFKANPHDVLVLSDTKAYATRYDKNVAATDDLSRGDDVVIFDPSTGELTGRIDLSGQASTVSGATIQARPDRLALVEGRVYVTLNNQDAKFAAAGEGAVVVIDPSNDTVAARVALAGLKGCEGLSALPAAKKLFVACGGSFADADQAASSGVAVLDLAVWPPAVVTTVRGSALGDGKGAVNFSWVGVLSPTRVLAATLGAFGDFKANIPGTKDAVFSIDLATGEGTALGIEGEAFDLGRAAVGASTLFVPDASSVANHPVVRAFDVSGADAVAQPTVDADPAQKLPPREIAWY